jgi:recombination protein RecA
MAMAHLAEVSKLGGTGLYIDVEQKASPHYFKSIFREQGADPSCIEIINPPHAEAVWETVQALAPEVDSIVIDSLAEMMTRARLDADVGEQQPGMLARIVQDGLKKSQIWSTDCVLLLINQVRERIGGYSNWNERTSGGRYRLHKAVMRIRVSRTKSFSESGKEIGVGVRAKIHKNQLGAPYGECLFRLYWGSGVDRHGDMIEVADELGLLAKSGSWYYLVYDNKYMGEENKRQGRDAVRVVFDEHPEMYDQLADKIAQVTQTGSID